MRKFYKPLWFSFIALSLNVASAQVFSPKTNAANYFNGVDVGDFAAPTFVDIDSDGDYDAFFGATNGTLLFYKNAGTKLNPQFLNEVAQNPLKSIFTGGFSAPTFVDIDGDGDKDLFVGSEENGIVLYSNTGTASAANFVLNNSLLSQLYFEIYSKPALVDLDKDGDLDLFVGDAFGRISYYKNVGTATIASFEAMPDNLNPLSSMSSAQYAAPVFVDHDKDGDFDFVMGGSGNNLRYYENTGSSTAPNFIPRTGTASPFNGVGAISSPTAAFVDIDDDGDTDLFAGGADGQIRSFANNTINLPLKLIAFSAVSDTDVAISWKTADEVNTASFQLEKSEDGMRFTTLKSIPAIGTGNNSYFARDQASISARYYRLKMIDRNGSYTLSSVIQTSSSAVRPQLNLYPNPAGETLTVQLPNQPAKPVYAEILDLSGRILIKTELRFRQQNIPIRQLSTGHYYLRMQSGESFAFAKR